MKRFDISQEVFGSCVYPGNDSPIMIEKRRMSRGDRCNMTSFSMCAHNGTHIDAPFHFLNDGITVEKLPLQKVIGECCVVTSSSKVTADEAEKIVNSAKKSGAEASKRILLKGDAVVTPDAAEIFAKAGISLLGVEPQAVSEASASAIVHKTLLSAEVVILEGIRLANVDDGIYFLNAAPLSLGGSDGAPCRAVLIDRSTH